MPTIADLRAQVERRWHGAARVARGVEAVRRTGAPEIDALLGGGMPAGKMTEIFGAASSGKTALALSALAACTREGLIGAYVDPARSFFAPAAHGAGVDLRRCLLVQPADAAGLRRAADALVRGGACAVVVIDCSSAGMSDALAAQHCARLVAHADRAGTALVVLSCGNVQSLAYFASLRLHVRATAPLWQPGADGGPQLAGYAAHVLVAKARAHAPGRSASMQAIVPQARAAWRVPEIEREEDATHRVRGDAALSAGVLLAGETFARRAAAGGR